MDEKFSQVINGVSFAYEKLKERKQLMTEQQRKFKWKEFVWKEFAAKSVEGEHFLDYLQLA